MTCKNCLHYDVCVIVEHSTRDDEDYLTEFGCEDFKDRANWREKKRGRWIWVNNHWECSVCRGSRFHDLMLGLDAAYCGHCGAFMEGSE